MSKLIVTIEDAVQLIRQQYQLPDWIEIQIGDTQSIDSDTDGWHDVSQYNEIDPPAATNRYDYIDIMYQEGMFEKHVTASSYRWNKLGVSGDIIKFRKAQ